MKTLREPIDVYHGNEAISCSKLSDFRRLPLYYYRRHIAKDLDVEETKAMRRGQAAHVMVLEGQSEYFRRYAIALELNFVGKKNKENSVALLNDNLDRPLPQSAIEHLADLKKDDILYFFDQHPGKIIVSENELELHRELRESVLEHPEASALLAGDFDKHAELVWRTENAELGLKLQCRSDWYNPDGCKLTDGAPYVVDWKTVNSLDELDYTNWEKNFRTFGYYIQDPFYRAVMADAIGQGSVERFFFVVTETKGLKETMVFEADAAARAAGWAECVSALRRLADCRKANVWPGHPTGIHTISLPKWYLDKISDKVAKEDG